MKLSSEIIDLINLFKQNGYKLYIVGGAVRDYLLNRPITDYDFTTDATPKQMLELLTDYLVDDFQSSLGSIKIHLNNKVYEITTFRKEMGVKDLRYPEFIEFVKDYKIDALRRDFTINSLAYSLDEGFIDCLNGIDDLNNKLIRFNKDINISINEDPIRIIRALRFMKTLDFTLSDSDLCVLKANAYKVSCLGKIKYDELIKLFNINGSKEFILKYIDIYRLAYPFLENDYFINALNSNINSHDLIYILGYYQLDSLNFNKKDRLIIKGLREIDLLNIDLYKTKILKIEYKDALEKIVNIFSCIGKDITQIKNYLGIITKENHPLFISDLDISYSDLEKLNISKSNYSKVFKYLLNLVLQNQLLNDKQTLIKLIKKGDF